MDLRLGLIQRARRGVECSPLSPEKPQVSVCHSGVDAGWRSIDHVPQHVLGLVPAPELQQPARHFAAEEIAPLAVKAELTCGFDSLPGHRDRLFDTSSLVECVAAVHIAAAYLLNETEAAANRQCLPCRSDGLLEFACRAQISAGRVEHVRLDRFGADRAGDCKRLLTSGD